MPRVNKRAAILHAAIEQFSYYGYSGASVDSIASKVGVSKTLIFKYYGTKEDLLVQCVKHILDGFVQKLISIAEQDGMTLRELIDRAFRVVKRNRSQWQFIARMVVTPALKGIGKNVIPKNMAKVEALLRRFTGAMEEEQVQLFTYGLLSLFLSYVVGGNESRFQQSKDLLLKQYSIEL